MGSIARIDPKPPLSCWYMSSRPGHHPQPNIGQNRVFEIERPEPAHPLPLKCSVWYRIYDRNQDLEVFKTFLNFFFEDWRLFCPKKYRILPHLMYCNVYYNVVGVK